MHSPPRQAQTAPHLYRLAVALTVIYYALLFLPLACFCLIVCCLPLFIVLYRLALPYAEREWRRARSADATQLAALPSTPYTPGMLSSAAAAGTGTGTSGTAPTPGGGISEEEDEATCVICLCEYVAGELVTSLPCRHHFHKKCIDEWLATDKSCPLCKQDIGASAVAAGDAAAVEAGAERAEGGDATVVPIGSPSALTARGEGGRGASGRDEGRAASDV